MQVTSWMIWIIYLLFISTSGGERGPWPSPAPPWIRHWWTHKRWAVGGRLLDQGVSNLAEYTTNIRLSEWPTVWWGDWDNARLWSLHTGGWCQTTLPECAGHLCTGRATVQRSPAQYKETDTYRNAIMYTSSVSWVAVNNVARRQQPRWQAYNTCNLKPPPAYQTVSTGSVLNRRSHSAEKYWIGPIQFWLDRAFSIHHDDERGFTVWLVWHYDAVLL